jgi:CubicO group peptidase (beta-lactamase class C family)
VAAGIDAHVAELAAVTTRTHERTSVDEDSTTNTDIASEIDHRAAVARAAAQLLRQHAEVRIIAHGHFATPAPESVAQELPEGHVRPAEVGSEAHKSIRSAHDAWHTGAYADQGCTLGERVDDLTAPLDDLIQESLTIPAAMTAFRSREDLTAQADKRGDAPLNAQVQGQDGDRCRDWFHDERRSPHTSDIPGTFAHQAQRGESAHKVADRAPIEPCDRGEVRSCLRAAEME